MIHISAVYLYRNLLDNYKNKGWLARAALGFVLNENNDQEKKDEYHHSDDDDRTKHAIIIDEKDERNTLFNCITGLVTLGSPHMSPKHNCMDITRGALR